MRRPNSSAIPPMTSTPRDVAILVDDRSFDAQLIKTFDGKAKLDGKPIALTLENLADVAAAIRAAGNGSRYNWLARTMAFAHNNRTIRVQDLPALKTAKETMEKTYGELDITMMSSRGYLNREPFMMVP